MSFQEALTKKIRLNYLKVKFTLKIGSDKKNPMCDCESNNSKCLKDVPLHMPRLEALNGKLC